MDLVVVQSLKRNNTLNEVRNPFFLRLLTAWRSPLPDVAVEEASWYRLAVIVLFPVLLLMFTAILFLGRWSASHHLSWLSVLLSVSLLPLSCVAVVAVVQAFNRKYPLRERLCLTDWRIADFFYALLVMVVMLPLIGVINSISLAVFKICGWKVADPALQNLFRNSPWSVVVILVFGAVVLAPLAEEIVFRRIIFTAINSKFGTTAGLMVTSLLFALVHDCRAQMPALFLLGIAMQLFYLERRRLAASITLHACNNAFAVGMMLLARINGWDWVFEM